MCDSLVALGTSTIDGVTLFAKNSDRPPQETQLIEWSPPRDERETHATHISIAGRDRATVRCIVSRPQWCWGAEHGVNEAGVAIGNHTIYTTLDPRSFPPALTGMDLVRLGLERAETAAAAVEVMTDLLEGYGQGGSGQDVAIFGRPKPYWSSFLVADPTSAWMVETSGSTWAAEQVVDVRGDVEPDVHRLVRPRSSPSRPTGRAPSSTRVCRRHERCWRIRR